MKKLILLSDLRGTKERNWIFQYVILLENHFDVKYYDSCELGDVSNKSNEKHLHEQFVNTGIEKAVRQLLNKEKDIFAIVGFSVGGTIAWQACLSGLKTQHLFAISSTRLRYETQKPIAKIKLFYGEKDSFKPSKDWFEQMNIKEINYSNEEHELYLKKEIIEDICKQIILEN